MRKNRDQKLYRTFSTRLHEALRDTNMKQCELAKNTEAGDSHISKILSAQVLPNADLIVRLSLALNVSADWLLGLSDHKIRQ